MFLMDYFKCIYWNTLLIFINFIIFKVIKRLLLKKVKQKISKKKKEIQFYVLFYIRKMSQKLNKKNFRVGKLH